MTGRRVLILVACILAISLAAVVGFFYAGEQPPAHNGRLGPCVKIEGAPP